MAQKTLYSIGELGEHHRVAVHKIRYCLDKFDIEPETTCAGVRLFGLKQLQEVGQGLAAISRGPARRSMTTPTNLISAIE